MRKIGLVQCAQCSLIFDIMTVNRWGICPDCEGKFTKIGQGFFFDGRPYGEAECSIVVVTGIKDGDASGCMHRAVMEGSYGTRRTSRERHP